VIKRLFQLCLSFILLLPTFAQESPNVESSAPETIIGHIVLANGTTVPLTQKEHSRIEWALANYEEIRANLQNLETLEKSSLEIHLNDFVVVIDDRGRVYVKGTTGSWKLGYMQGTLEVKTNTQVVLKPEKESIFTSSVKFVAGIGASLNTDLTTSEEKQLVGHQQLGFSFQFVRIGKAGFDVGLTTDALFGGVSFGITTNSSLIVGAGRRWEGDPTVILLLGFKL